MQFYDIAAMFGVIDREDTAGKTTSELHLYII